MLDFRPKKTFLSSGVFLLPKIKSACFGPVTTSTHVAPPPASVPAGIQKKPAAFGVCTALDSLKIIGQKKVGCTSDNRVNNPVQRIPSSSRAPDIYISRFNVRQTIALCKFLAVRSGLARYGRNNITYVDGMGSLYRLSAFLSDLPCPGDCWTEPQMHDRCDDCSICLRACPTDAIPQHRFLLHAERCITFHNETRGPFPPWLDPSWHNCLVGCLHCQRVCPLNSGLLKKVKQGPVFTHAETASLLEKHPTERISPRTTTKLKKLDLLEYGDVLGRNLKALMTKYSVPGFPSTD